MRKGQSQCSRSGRHPGPQWIAAIALTLFAGIAGAQDSALSLSELFARALAQNPALEERGWQQKTAQSRLEESRSALRPQLRFQSEVSYAWMEMDSFARASNQLKLTYPLYDESLEDERTMAQFGLEAEKSLRQAREQQTLRQVATLYYQYWQDRAQVDFLRKEQRFLRETLKQVEQRLQVGYQDLEDVAEIEARLDQNRAERIRAEARVQERTHALSEQVGESLENEVLAAPQGRDSDAAPLTRPADWGLAVESHPLLEAWRQKWRVSQQRIDRERNRDGIKVEAFGALVYNESDGHYYDDMRGTRGGVRLEWPLYVGGGTAHRVAQARGRSEAVATQIRQQQLALQKSARDAWLGIQSAHRQRTALEEAKRSSRQAVNATEQAIRTGERDVIDLINAQRSFYRVERDLAVLNSEIGLQKAIFNWSLGRLNMK